MAALSIRITKNPIKSTIIVATAVLGIVLLAQSLSVAILGFTSECGKAYIAIAIAMTLGTVLCLSLEKQHPNRAITYLCYLIFVGIGGWIGLYCANGVTEFPKTISVLICGIFVLRWSGLKRRATVYGYLTAAAIVATAWACSSVLGTAGAAFSILSIFFPKDRT
jgi:hypothetical protein